jgi:hypothetical protein
MLLATLGVGCALVVVGARPGFPLTRALFAPVALLSLVLVEALWWERPWLVRATDAWVAACIGTVLLACLAAVPNGPGLGLMLVFAALAAGFVALPCALVRWYVRDRAGRLGLRP